VWCDSCERHYLGLDEGEYTFAPRTLAGRRTCVSCYIATVGDTSEQQRRLTTRYEHHGYRFCGGLRTLGAALTCCKVRTKRDTL
jgi:hypothetical protein